MNGVATNDVSLRRYTNTNAERQMPAVRRKTAILNRLKTIFFQPPVEGCACDAESFCRLGDLVGRYGGEEFTLLLADCSGATSYGTTAETCVLLANTIGEANPPISTCAPPSVVATFPVD